MTGVQVEYCGEHYTPQRDRPFHIGREGDLRVEDNPYLHRHFLELQHRDGLWWIANVGVRLAATISSAGGAVQSWLSPGARMPLVFERSERVGRVARRVHPLAWNRASAASSAL